jgi:hypothetical protein
MKIGYYYKFREACFWWEVKTNEVIDRSMPDSTFIPMIVRKKRMSHICILLKQSADMHPGFGYKENWNLSTLLGCNKITTNRRHEQKMIFEADKELTKDNLRFSRTNFFYYQLGHYRSCCCLQFQSYPKSDTAGIPINVDSAIHECGDPRGPSATVDFITFSCKFMVLEQLWSPQVRDNVSVAMSSIVDPGPNWMLIVFS